ncbi:SMP-30/gluconolactonase/LRE family protein [Paraglaciecola aquimarina]|uniref:SMP-30/gluconolactonase/LRE family protein n=1 Tax=Paraglaciecola algarum TaxID=3050085 RepID=A0ABS9D9Z7_9ALTE|nr:SMP-30/gluconolactonase/LRE family protein [Paraglaciecola sp. G1-23]MCF2948609.1 SMP-30/gluconolactonase/LRE family protein [Paraglaciecola sp. G1-23]
MAESIQLTQKLAVGNTLGEGVIWDHRQEIVYWTDIQQSTLFSWKFGDLQAKQYMCPERLGCFGLTPNLDWLICGFESGFAFFNPHTGKINWIQKVETEYSHTRLNDGRVDRQGRFWAGSMMQDEGADESRARASLYRLEHNHQVTKVIEQIKVSNGLCWSPNGDTLYFADSPTQTIRQAKMNTETGDIGQLTQFAKTDSHAYPDGSCVDNQGCIWNAQWASNTVKRYSPDGELLLTLDVPCKQPSCVAFGGPDLQHLFVTSARIGLSEKLLDEQPSNGNLFVYHTPYTGLPESICLTPFSTSIETNK